MKAVALLLAVSLLHLCAAPLAAASGADMDVNIASSGASEHELVDAIDVDADDAVNEAGNPNGAEAWMTLPGDKSGRNGGTVYREKGQTAGDDDTAPFFYRTNTFNTDYDGAPTAYNPKGRSGGALDYTANAGGPGNWYGVVTNNGKSSGTPVVQGANDPAPGFYVSQTSLEDPSRARTDPRRYVDASKVPYAVLPSNLQGGKTGAHMGDYATIINPKTGRMTQAIIADSGPRNQIGEGSKAAQDAIGANNDAIWVVYPNSRNKDKPFQNDPAAIQAEGQKQFDKFGGMKKINDMYGTKFPTSDGQQTPAGAGAGAGAAQPQGLMSQPQGLMSMPPPEDPKGGGGGAPGGGAPAGGAPGGGAPGGGDAPGGGGGGASRGVGGDKPALGAAAPGGEETLEEKQPNIAGKVQDALKPDEPKPEGEGEGKGAGGGDKPEGGDGGDGGGDDGGGGGDRGGRGDRRGGRRGGGRGDRRGGRGRGRGGRRGGGDRGGR